MPGLFLCSGTNGTSRVSTGKCDAKPLRVARHINELISRRTTVKYFAGEHREVRREAFQNRKEYQCVFPLVHHHMYFAGEHMEKVRVGTAREASLDCVRREASQSCTTYYDSISSHHPSAALRVLPPETHHEPLHGDSSANVLLATVSGGSTHIPALVIWIL